MKIKKIHKIWAINALLWGPLLSLASYDAFIADTEGSFSKGQLQGGLVAIGVFFLVVLPAIFMYNSIKIGHRGGQIAADIKKNYLTMISIEWWKSK